MPVIKVFIKGLNKVVEFPSTTALADIEKAIKVNWSQVEEISGLPMDTASRMARAERLGFDTNQTVFHGTTGDFSEFIGGGPEGVTAGELFGRGIYTSKDPNVANSFISGEGANIISLKTTGKFFDKNTKLSGQDSTKINKFIAENSPELMERFANDFGIKRKKSVFNKDNMAEGRKLFKDSQQKVKDSGLPEKFRPITSRADNGDIVVDHVDVSDAVDFESKEPQDFINSIITSGRSSDILEDLGYQGLDYNDTERLIFSPENIRSTNAAFNPAKKDSANLLAGGASAAVGIGLTGQSEESEAGVVGSIAKEMKRLHPNIKSFITESDGVATLQKVVVDEANRGAGQGSKFMDDFLRLADEKGSTTALTPSADFGGNKKRLEGFYEGFGFKPNKGRNKDFSISETLIRSPKTSGSALAALTASQAQANTARIDTPSSIAINAPFIDQNNIPSHLRAGLGGIESPVGPTFINQAGAKLQHLELPVIGNPLGGIADYLLNFSFPDSAEERAKRAAMAALDII